MYLRGHEFRSAAWNISKVYIPHDQMEKLKAHCFDILKKKHWQLYITKAGDSLRKKSVSKRFEAKGDYFYEMNYPSVLVNLKLARSEKL